MTNFNFNETETQNQPFFAEKLASVAADSQKTEPETKENTSVKENSQAETSSQKQMQSPKKQNQSTKEPNFENDRNNVNVLLSLGVINHEKAQEIFKKLDAIEHKYNEQKKSDFTSEQVQAFLADNPDFASIPEKAEILYYLKSKNSLTQEELGEVSRIVKSIEALAVKKFQEAQKQALQTQNIDALSRISSVAQNFSSAPKEAEKIFTKDDIIKMSNKEFLKNEQAIKKQLLEGKIK